MKHCAMGNHDTPLSEFGVSKATRDGLNCSCRKCIRNKYRSRYTRYAVKYKKKANRDKFQLNAFRAMYKAARIGGRDNFEAFASAITGSCDDAFDKLPPGSVDKWLTFRGEETRGRK